LKMSSRYRDDVYGSTSTMVLRAALLVAAHSAAHAARASAEAAGPPTIAELTSLWMDPNKTVSEDAALGAEQRDLATINNFWGAVGIAPEGVRPVDMFAINSLEMPPFAGCGCDPHHAPFGCGSMQVDGEQVAASATRWATHEAGRRAAALPGSGVVVESATRMPFETNAVLWTINFTNPTSNAASIRVDFRLSGMVNKLSSVGTWVYPAINDPTKFNFTAATSGDQKGSESCGGGIADQPGMGHTVQTRSACSRYTFVGAQQPDEIVVLPPPPPPPPLPPSCSIAGSWIQESSGDTFGPITEDTDAHTFAWSHNPKYTTEGWSSLNGSLSVTGHSIHMIYYRTYDVSRTPHPPVSPAWISTLSVIAGLPAVLLCSSSGSLRVGQVVRKKPMQPVAVQESGQFVDDCDHIHMSDSAWHRVGSKPHGGSGGKNVSSPVPTATFSALKIGAGETVTLKIAFAVGESSSDTAAVESACAKDEATFEAAWTAAHDKWQERWEQAFTPNNGFWSGNLPTLTLESGGDDDTGASSGGGRVSSAAADVSRVYYMSILTVVSQMRTNLPLIFERVWPNGNGNVGHTTMGVGGSRSWWWDESLTSMMLALLDPVRIPQAIWPAGSFPTHVEYVESSQTS
jgi:hypothetical protein